MLTCHQVIDIYVWPTVYLWYDVVIKGRRVIKVQLQHSLKYSILGCFVLTYNKTVLYVNKMHQFTFVNVCLQCAYIHYVIVGQTTVVDRLICNTKVWCGSKN